MTDGALLLKTLRADIDKGTLRVQTGQTNESSIDEILDKMSQTKADLRRKKELAKGPPKYVPPGTVSCARVRNLYTPGRMHPNLTGMDVRKWR
jgi:hypothetical protein